MQRKHAELIKAWADGAEIEQGIKTADGEVHWTTPKLVTWRDNQIYRIKKKRLNIMTTFTTEDRVNASPPHIVDTGASYEPIPFAGIVNITDKEDTEAMLRHQLHIVNEQLKIVQAECQRLRNKLREAGIND